jgi:hypothetical protein
VDVPVNTGQAAFKRDKKGGRSDEDDGKEDTSIEVEEEKEEEKKEEEKTSEKGKLKMAAAGHVGKPLVVQEWFQKKYFACTSFPIPTTIGGSTFTDFNFSLVLQYH